MKMLNDSHHDNDLMNYLNLFDDDPLSFHNLLFDNQLLGLSEHIDHEKIMMMMMMMVVVVMMALE
jgi:hypothetical protein